MTKKKITKRKRFLLDTVQNLHLKFCSESSIKIARSLFYKLKPFWICARKVSERDTCLCKKHENINLILKKLTRLKMLTSSSTKDFTDLLTCDSSSKACMYRECNICRDKVIPRLKSL